MAQHHKYSIAELENLMPFERDLYVDMLLDYIEEQNAKNYLDLELERIDLISNNNTINNRFTTYVNRQSR